MTYPTTAPASGAYPISTSWGATGTFQNTDQDNTNAVANYAWGGVDQGTVGCRVATTGAETFTIVSGSVTTISGTTIDGVSVAVNDIVLNKDSPASSGVGSVGSTQPANGIYVVTAVATNISLARAATMSTTSSVPNPAGRVAFVRAGTTNAFSMWMVDSPVADATFTYGTTAMQWKNYLLNASDSLIPSAANTLNLGSSTDYWASTFTNVLAFEGSTPQITGNPAFTGSPTFTGGGIPNNAIQQAGINNFNHALQSQTVVSATPYYVTNSALTMPATPLTGMTASATAFIWDIAMSKTAAGTGTFQIVIYRGTAGTTADTADVTQTIGTQTAAADNLSLRVQLVVTTVGGTGAYYWTIIPSNKAGAGAGFGVPSSAAFLNGTVSSVALNTASLKFGIGFIATTGTPTVTVPMVQAFAYNMD